MMRRAFRLTQPLAREAGVAMVTVLLVGAALTAVASSAAYVTIYEFRASTDDRKAAESLAYSEAGIDRLVFELRRGKYTWADIREAGCDKTAIKMPTGQVGGGTFDAELVAFNPFATGANRFPPAACSAVADDSPRTPHYFAVTSTGQHPTARRVVRQVLLIRGIDLPIGIYAEDIETNGTPNFVNISMLSATNVTQREKMGFSGTDLFYKVGDFWGDSAANAGSYAPAAVHALGSIYLKTSQQNKTEHTDADTLNCVANGTSGTAGQSQWDQSGNGGTITKPACAAWVSGGGAPTGPPPTSKIETFEVVAPTPKLSDQDFLTLRGAAKQNGLYCSFTGIVTNCTAKGTATTLQGGKKVSSMNLDPITDTNFVVYMEFDPSTTLLATNTVEWDADVLGCNPTDPGRSATIIIRNGNMFASAGRYINGVLLAPEGEAELRGGATLNGTVIAKNFDTVANPTIKMNACWLLNMPGPFLRIEPFTWSEIDR